MRWKLYCKFTLLAIQGLIDSNLLSWVSSMTYQSVSGAGASCVKELLMQMSDLSNDASINVDDDTNDLLDNIDYLFANKNLSTKYTQIPLIGNLIPWIDSDLNNGQSREEWKGGAEANKILNNKIFLLMVFAQELVFLDVTVKH